MWLSEDPWVGDGVNLVEYPLSTKTRTNLDFPEGYLGTSLRASPAYSLFRPQLTSDGYIEIVHYRALKSTQKAGNKSFSIPQFRPHVRTPFLHTSILF